MVKWSLELSPLSLVRGAMSGKLLRLMPLLPRGTSVYLPNLPADPPECIEHAIQAVFDASKDVQIVPHIAASRVQSEADLLQRLDRWQLAANGSLKEVLVVHGDSRAHAVDGAAEKEHTGGLGGPYLKSLDLLDSGVLQRRGISCVGLCGHPEGIALDSEPSVSCEAAIHILGEKVRVATARGLEPNVVTQFCFSAARSTDYIDALRDAGAETRADTQRRRDERKQSRVPVHAVCAGVTQPVSLGVVGPAKSSLLQRMAAHCRVAPPDSAVTGAVNVEQPSAILQSYLFEIAQWHLQRGGDTGLQTLHLYPFGGLERTLRFLSNDPAAAMLLGDPVVLDLDSAFSTPTTSAAAANPNHT